MMNDVYIIQTQEEYDAVLTRLSLLENNVKYKRVKETNFVEIIKLNNAVKDWERRKYKEMYGKMNFSGTFGFFDD